jgi:rRNA maturation endonuclease Nob1
VPSLLQVAGTRWCDVRVLATRLCPNCGGRVKIVHVDVTVDGDVEMVVELEGMCESCGAKYRLTRRIYLKGGGVPWRAKLSITV